MFKLTYEKDNQLKQIVVEGYKLLRKEIDKLLKNTAVKKIYYERLPYGG